MNIKKREERHRKTSGNGSFRQKEIAKSKNHDPPETESIGKKSAKKFLNILTLTLTPKGTV